MLSKDSPVERVLMVIGLYQLQPGHSGGGGGGSDSGSVLAMTHAHVFHFLQQVARFLMAIQPTTRLQEDDGCREEADTQAMYVRTYGANRPHRWWWWLLYRIVVVDSNESFRSLFILLMGG